MKSNSMKSIKSLCLTIVILQLICLVQSQKSVVKKNSSKKTNSTSSAQVLKSLNSLGQKVEGRTSLESFPYNVTRCDQIVIVKGDFMPDLGNYSLRKEGLFVFTAHHANLFSARDPSKLIQSILLSETNSFPSPIRGARGCLSIDAGVKNKMTLCVGTVRKLENLIEVMNKFSDCRGGLLIGEGSKKEQLKAKQTCRENLKKIEAAKKEEKKQESQFFHPGEDRVPGSLPPKIKGNSK